MIQRGWRYDVSYGKLNDDEQEADGLQIAWAFAPALRDLEQRSAGRAGFTCEVVQVTHALLSLP